ncbi:MAG: RusA family crossover junction endodeoxyribonuclease [Promicromonosporaceae bacterium]|nr:RusA family crossover junction endodeoxyribonuclease [Promicromonosporaceae bacterium]
MPSLVFSVPGLPVPQGSKRVARHQIIETNAAKLRPWRATVTATAIETAQEDQWPQAVGPVSVYLTFRLPRPKAHYRTGAKAGELKPAAPYAVTSKPDIDKLTRAILDALTDAGIWRDDSQVVRLHAQKIYNTLPSVGIWIETADD